MKKRIKDTNMPIGKMSRIEDFLPPPDKLVIPKETVKVTLSLTKTSVEFFKRQAKRNHTQYQKMIRQLIDQYTIRYSH
jgi:predicted DNA binding CopG/RHH family protein